MHVNHATEQPRYGVLLCVNGTACCNAWLKRAACTVGDSSIDYAAMNDLAAATPVGADGLSMLPFGNGAERTLQNQDLGASLAGLNFNIHDRGHLLRAAQEGIVFALKYGIDAMADAGVSVQNVRAGHANMFLSPLFREAFATATGATVELYDTDGAQGAARGAGIGSGAFSDAQAAFAGLRCQATIEPNAAVADAYHASYERWLERLNAQIG